MEQTKIDKIKELQQIQYDSTTPMDSYHTGLWNGLELALAILEDRDAKFKAVEQLSFGEIKPQDATEVF